MTAADAASPAGPRTCRAAIADGAGQFALGNVQVRAPGPGEVRVRIEAAGLCHTDLQSLHWPGPLVMGHEGAGRVEAVGAGVDGLQCGDAVVLNWAIPCGGCDRCRAGDQHLCHRSHGIDPALGSPAPEPAGTQWQGRPVARAFHLGTFARFTLVRAAAVTLLPDGPPASQACILGCGVMTGVGAALNTANVRPGKSVAVFGCGGVGLNVIQGAAIAGAEPIIAVDVLDNKLALAKQFGATHTVNPKEVDAVAKIKEITGGNGANFTFEAVGKAQTLEQALWSRDLAGTCVFIGVPGPGPTLNLPLQKFFDLGGHLCVSWYGDCLPSRDFPLLADWYRQGQLKLDEVVTRTVSLDEVEEAFAAMERGETLRSVIVF